MKRLNGELGIRTEVRTLLGMFIRGDFRIQIYLANVSTRRCHHRLVKLVATQCIPMIALSSVDYKRDIRVTKIPFHATPCRSKRPGRSWQPPSRHH